MKLEALTETFAVCRLAPSESIPAWVTRGSSFFSITQTQDELSIVCEQSQVPPEVKSEKNWTALRVVGSLDFSLTGILASIANPLAQNEISIFAISSFDTDYILIKKTDWSKAEAALSKAGFEWANP